MSNSALPDPRDITASVVRALVLYSLAEFQAGHATTVRVTAEGASFSIADDGRGHAINRTIGGAPYLQFVYTHLDYPFESCQDAPIQLHAIGISLINALCKELTVTVLKQDVTLRMSFRDGQLFGDELLHVRSEETGNAISGTVSPQMWKGGVDIQPLRKWLQEVLAANPSLTLFLNGQALHAHSRSAA